MKAGLVATALITTEVLQLYLTLKPKSNKIRYHFATAK
jgi:hypothetical protein